MRKYIIMLTLLVIFTIPAFGGKYGKHEIAVEEKIDDKNIVTVMSLNEAIEHYRNYEDPCKIENLAEKLYKKKDCEKCKLAVVCELAALKLQEAIIQNWFFNEFSIEEVLEFQEDNEHTEAFFDKLVAQQKCPCIE